MRRWISCVGVTWARRGQTGGKEVWTRSWKNIVQNILWWRHYDVTMMYGNNDVIIAIRSAFSNIFFYLFESLSQIKWRAWSSWSFHPISPWGSKETTTMRRMRPTLSCGFIGWKVPYSSNKILPMKFYSSSLELSILQTHIIV